MKETVYHGCSITGLTWEEFEVVRDALANFRIDKQNAERAVEIGHNIQKEMLELRELGFDVYYGRIRMTDTDNLQIIKT